MSGLLAENAGAGQESPVKRNKLSLKFFQKKDTKRALDFSEPQAEEAKTVEQEDSPASCDQVVYGPAPCPSSPGLPIPCEKKENLVPFVGLNNLGNTCYLNSILQVLYYCPGFREGVKNLYNLSKRPEKSKDETAKNEEHDAQEVLQCILGYIQEACDTIRKEQELERKEDNDTDVKKENGVPSDSSFSVTESRTSTDEDGQVSGKRKSDTEVGNAKKKPKSKKSESTEENVCRNKPFTRSKRKSSSDITVDSAQSKEGEQEQAEEKKNLNPDEEKDEKASSKERSGKRKKRGTLGWLRSSGKQPSIFSKFYSVGKISSTNPKPQNKSEPENRPSEKPKQKSTQQSAARKSDKDQTEKQQDVLGLMEKLFQGRLVLRTRCLECESFTERREDFQDISVPVLDDQPASPEDPSEDPKPEMKTLTWAISQFASVERIVGEDKYFCETCHHYTEAERSLLFDKTPEVITIHLKRFSASSLEVDPYAGLSKVNTPLQTPLTLSLNEWCTKPSAATGQQYELFAVVMHSGVSISSGHYTTYIRMADLKDVKVWLQDKKEKVTEEDLKESKERAQTDENTTFDDGEVSVSLSTRGQRRAGLASTKSGSKKLLEGGIGLLGGQRSLPNCELGSGSKAANRDAAEGSKRRKTLSSSGQNTGGLKKEPEDAAMAPPGGMEAAEQQALTSLLEYEGKWLLFDDSEVRLFEEEDFLRACSPETCSSSTPYLLFYKRMPEPQH
ncbi:hypothetical protein CCH79_00009458 [Gambusia affinis]|uniref:Ubiquitin carboxyl-terminal hydrolase n=1 Tax=Gambusia affinis TaxID=33528 RepID=A0A315VDS5_GAMAF|nr:hypothetical protein CCH79_00009458 [Gambusia affinis]